MSDDLSLGGPESNECISFGTDQYMESKRRRRDAENEGKNTAGFEHEMHCWQAYTEGYGGSISIGGPNALPPDYPNYEDESYWEHRNAQIAEVDRLLAEGMMAEPRPFGANQPEEVPQLGQYYSWGDGKD